MQFRFSIHQKQSLTFLIISGSSILVFLFLSNLFVMGGRDFVIFETALIILLLWIGCALISYLLNKKYTWQKHTFIRLILHTSLILFLISGVSFLFEILPKMIKHGSIDYGEIKLSVIVMILICFAVSAIGEAKDIILVWKATVVRADQLEKENIRAQFNALKSQVNPHFLFNSLNTLATYVQDMPEVNLYVKNLSEYLRHTLTIKEDALIRINEELNLVNKYIFLQKARFKDNLIIETDIPEEMKTNGYIPPFSLQMVIENAIKHNITSKSKPLHIKIFTDDDRYLVIENNLQVRETQGTTKLGLKNIEERYRLISDKYIRIEKTEEIFRVSLPVIDNPVH